jgi:hypothetical protein
MGAKRTNDLAKTTTTISWIPVYFATPVPVLMKTACPPFPPSLYRMKLQTDYNSTAFALSCFPWNWNVRPFGFAYPHVEALSVSTGTRSPPDDGCNCLPAKGLLGWMSLGTSKFYQCGLLPKI